MAILITGGAGYVGSHVALGFLDSGQHVVIVDNLVSGQRNQVPAGATFVEADIRDAATLEAVMQQNGVESVIHCAASTVVPESVALPLEYYDNNVAGTIQLLKAMQAAGVRRILFSSTAAVYATGDGSPLTEDSPVRPASPYGMTKLMTEHVIADAARAGLLDYVILRYFNVAGADPQGRSGQSTPNATHLIKLALEAACGKRDTMTIFGDDWPTPDGTGVRDFIHVSDLAQAHVMCADHLAQGRGNAVFNCGYGRGYSVREVLDMVEEVSGTLLKKVTQPRRPGDLAQVIAQSDRIQREIGWIPRHDNLRAIITHAHAWETRLSHPAAPQPVPEGVAQ